MAEDGQTPDAVEVWAKRVGRALGLIFVLALALYLVATYWPR